MSNAAPTHYEVRTPVFAKGATPEEAVEAAKKIIKQREEDFAKSRNTADAAGLPELSGSPKQIAWAIKIRDAIFQKNPKDPSIRRISKAKTWIDRRQEFGWQ